MSTSALFAHRDFRLLLVGQTASQIGPQVSGVAIPLLAVLTLHASPFELGLVTASSTLAFALIGLPAGAWLDRLRRRPVLVASDLVRAVLLATIPLAAILGVLSITQLVIVSPEDDAKAPTDREQSKGPMSSWLAGGPIS